MGNKLFSVISYLNFMVIQLIFILVHIGIGIALFYSDDSLNFWGIFTYLSVLGILLFIGISFGFRKFILSAIVFGCLCGLGWYSYNYINIPYVNTCSDNLPLRGADNRCYACNTPYSIDIRNPDINPCPNRKIGKRYCCGVEYDVSSLELKDSVFDTVLCRCVEKSPALLVFCIGIIAISFYVGVWALLFGVVGVGFKKDKR